LVSAADAVRLAHSAKSSTANMTAKLCFFIGI
jgi:hypothetical protein